MNLTLVVYVSYFVITVPLAIWVARQLHHNGEIFLIEVFHGDQGLARSINNLLVVGFYLLNLGYIAFTMKTGAVVSDSVVMMETIARKVGGVSLILGVVHLANVWVFNRFRKRAVREASGYPPVLPDTRLFVPAPNAGDVR